MGALTKREEEKLFEEMQREEVIEKEVSFSWDGKNLVVRFPKEIAETLKVTKENRKLKKLKFTIKVDGDKATKEFSIINKDGKKK